MEKYLAAHDMLFDATLVHGIRMQELRDRALAAKKQNVLIILDCCYSGLATAGIQERAVSPIPAPVEPCFSSMNGSGKFILASSG